MLFVLTTGGIIYGYEGVKKAFLTGRGKILLRSKVFFEKIGCLIIKIRDESDRTGMRIVFYLKNILL